MEKDKKGYNLYRKRYIPIENVHLKNDKIIFADKTKIITEWATLKPRTDISHGCSCYFINEGYKISKIWNNQGELVYYYCDIIQTFFDPVDNAYTFHDLLADVIVYNDGTVKVIDVGELSEALEKNIISIEQVKIALTSLDCLLNIIYSGNFGRLTKYLDL